MLSAILGLSVGVPALAARVSAGFDRLLDAVVRIDVRETDFDSGTSRLASSIGSGVILSADGLVLTNAHVASPDAVEINVTLASLERVGASLVGWDHWTDLALLRIDMDEIRRRHLGFAAAKFGRSESLYPGETVYAVGTPYGLTRTVTKGIISNTRRYFEDAQGVRGYETGAFNTWLQTDAAINPGNSGGPLVTENGAVIGINSRSYLGADNLGFAIPADVAKTIVAGLVRDGRITRSYIGIVPGVLRDLEGFYALAQNTGMLINSVDTGSPAAAAGLRGGDILLSINGRSVDGRFPEQLPAIQNLIAAQAVGTTLRLAVKRAGATREFTVVTERLESRVGEEDAFESWGLSVRKISRTYAREHQLADATGMLVLGVRPGYPAAVAGVSAGDIVTKIDRQPVTSLEVARKLQAEYARHPAPTLVETNRHHRVSLYVFKP
jgi:serine protease Do